MNERCRTNVVASTNFHKLWFVFRYQLFFYNCVRLFLYNHQLREKKSCSNGKLTFVFSRWNYNFRDIDLVFLSHYRTTFSQLHLYSRKNNKSHHSTTFRSTHYQFFVVVIFLFCWPYFARFLKLKIVTKYWTCFRNFRTTLNISFQLSLIFCGPKILKAGLCCRIPVSLDGNDLGDYAW